MAAADSEDLDLETQIARLSQDTSDELEAPIPGSSDDMEKVQKINNLGFTWRRILNELLEKQVITQKLHNKKVELYELRKKLGTAKLKAKTSSVTAVEDHIRGKNCGVTINSGTYGYIFQSTKDPNIAIKASINGHSITTGCPPEFTREYYSHKDIKTYFPNLKIINLLDIKDKSLYVDDQKRRCYFEMEKLYPIEINQKQKVMLNAKISEATDTVTRLNIEHIEVKEILDRHISETTTDAKEKEILEKEIIETTDVKEKKIKLQNDLIYKLDQINTVPRLYMIVPGINDTNYFNEGGPGKGLGWREINEDIMKYLFEILSIDIKEYYDELISILKSTIEKGIYLIDVEFILCSSVVTNESGQVVTNEAGKSVKQNKIVMLDFDKVDNGPPGDDRMIERTLNQDMFPEYVKTEIKRIFNITTGGKRSRKSKRSRK